MRNFRVWLEATRKEEALKDSKKAYEYARDVIKGRWPEGETAIAKSPIWAYHYAAFVLRGRWPEAEAVIVRSPENAYWYAREVIKGRWPEGEATIMKEPEYAYEYAKDVIKGRWPEAEAAMISDPRWGPKYLDFVLEPVYKQIKTFSDFIEHPDVIGLAKNFTLLKGVINGSPKALRRFYMEIAPWRVREMMLRYEP